MKKIIAYFLISSLLCLCAACGEKPSSQDDNPTKTTATTTITTETATTTQPTAQTAPPMTAAQAAHIAKEKIDAYYTATALGVCCQWEYVDEDMSQFLTETQQESYLVSQGRLTCCSTPEQVKAHFARTVSPALLTPNVDEVLFFDDQQTLYVIFPGRGIDDYRVSVKEYTDTRILAVCEIIEMGSDDVVSCRRDLTLEKQNNEFIIVACSDYY